MQEAQSDFSNAVSSLFSCLFRLASLSTFFFKNSKYFSLDLSEHAWDSAAGSSFFYFSSFHMDDPCGQTYSYGERNALAPLPPFHPSYWFRADNDIPSYLHRSKRDAIPDCIPQYECVRCPQTDVMHRVMATGLLLLLFSRASPRCCFFFPVK